MPSHTFLPADTKPRKRTSAVGMKRKRGDEPGGTPGPLQLKKQRLLQDRTRLPIWSRKEDIQRALEKHNVLVLSGETGSGKSTQIPQFLLGSKWCSRCIAITQPRRVAAVSLARRVAEEMGSPLGASSPASTVGYSVRFDESVSPSTRIKYLTEGMLLQEMLRDSALSQYSCVIVDEVHERSVNVDLLLGFLKPLMHSKKRKTALKLVVMSATADVGSIAQYFGASPHSSLVARAKPNGLLHSQANGRSNDQSNLDLLQDDGKQREVPSRGLSSDDGERLTANNVAKLHVEGRQYPVKLHYLDRPTDDVAQAALERILQVHCKEPLPGDVLVFLTGQEVIQSLQKLVEEYTQSLPAEAPKLLILPLFAALPQSAQQRIFQPPPPRTRKVILSTNIAETSVTVPGVRYVVDTGKAKVKQFRNRLSLDSLLVKSISKSSADQRKGRAGREAPGQCFRLYTESAYKALDKDNRPEILRCDLSEALLKMKARGVADVLGFPFLTPPPREAIEKALLHLLQLGTLHEDGKLSDVGSRMAKLPLAPTLGRVIIEAARPGFGCVIEVIDIVACLSVENIFLHVETEEARERAETSRQQLLRRSGDHLTLLAAVNGYAGERADRRRWAEDHLISHRAMQSVMDVRKQLRALCTQVKLLSSEALQAEPTNADDALAAALLRCFLRGAFPSNVARLCPDGSYKTLVGNQTVAIHPSSVLFGRKVEAILYNEFVFTNKAYARNVSAIQLSWLNEVLDQDQ